MPLVVVMEDDAGTRLLVTQVLKKQGFEVHAAENGAKGLELIRLHRPDLVVSDVQMPEMDGFAVLDIVRNTPELATTAYIMLTSLQDRTHMRHGMTTGADDYLTKPFSPQELREAVAAQINKLVRQDAARSEVVDQAVASALDEQKRLISDLYEKRLAKSLSEQWPESGYVAEGEKFNSATALFADIRDYALWTQRLSGSELGALIKMFYGSVGDTVHLFGARYMQFVGDGMLCVFVDDNDTQSVSHALRAARAAVGLSDVTRRVDAYVKQQFPDRQMPAFALSVALHSGPVAFASLEGGFGGRSQLTPVGDTVAAALGLFNAQPALDWRVAASAQTAHLLTGNVRSGRRAMVQLPGRPVAIDAVEILSLIA
jgi:CheY-like chemotaxis protein